MSLFTELKRRNVLRVGAAYVVVGWLLLQVADIVFGFMGVPDWVGKAIIAILVLGFIPTLAVAWIFELTPEGVQRESDLPQEHENSTAARKLDTVTIIAVVLVAALTFYQLARPVPNSPPEVADGAQTVEQTDTADAVQDGNAETSPTIGNSADIPEQSIAVLPFADLSPEGDQAYFSDGISEEILNVLVGINELKVASRTSAFAYKDQPASSLPLIAQQLGVAHILEGSVRKAGDNIRITAQLIDADTDQHLWSNTYDRTLTAASIFAIQDEIAQAIVQELGLALGGQSPADAVESPADTDNLNAYELYLKGREGFLVRSTDNLPDTIETLEQAVAVDPDFARAWAQLAAAYSVAPSWLGDAADREYFALAEQAANKAIELDDELSLPYAVLGSLDEAGEKRDFARALAYFNQALEKNPKDTTALLWRGIDYTNLGYFDRAEQDLNRCLQIDPAYENCRQHLAVSHLYEGETATALELYARAIVAGATSQSRPFFYYLAANDRLEGAALLLTTSVFLGVTGDQPYTLIQAFNDPAFEYEKEWQLAVQQYSSEYEAPDESNLLNYIFKRYEHLKPRTYEALWWQPGHDDFMQSPHRYRLMREVGVYDYWREHGFPERCRPLGEDDFECD